MVAAVDTHPYIGQQYVRVGFERRSILAWSAADDLEANLFTRLPFPVVELLSAHRMGQRQKRNYFRKTVQEKPCRLVGDLLDHFLWGTFRVVFGVINGGKVLLVSFLAGHVA